MLARRPSSVYLRGALRPGASGEALRSGSGGRTHPLASLWARRRGRAGAADCERLAQSSARGWVRLPDPLFLPLRSHCSSATLTEAGGLAPNSSPFSTEEGQLRRRRRSRCEEFGGPGGGLSTLG